MCTSTNHHEEIVYAKGGRISQNQNRGRQQTFTWQRLLVARPQKPARSDTDD
ncbi:MAG: hypothetical protein IPL78_16115 [Chloroflexi bacterium]|nr:hypothetical protein [Chloroflexota bacterium]